MAIEQLPQMGPQDPPPVRPPLDRLRWQADVQGLWDHGLQQPAIDLLLERINAARPAVPLPLGLQLVYYIYLLGDLPAAERFLRLLRQAHPDDPQVLENLAVVLSRQGRCAEALPLFQQVLALTPDAANLWDGVTACLSRLKRFDEASQAGDRALAIKSRSAQPLEDWRPPDGSPAAFLSRPDRRQRCDVVAFSIWGAHPRYLRGALRNALLIPEVYPGWQARFYLDATVPEEFRSLLGTLGADCRLMPARQSLRQKLCWRFLVANDLQVGRFLVRDCDSVVNQREANAVREWLHSPCWFHVMRDWWTHTDPILAGLWGGIAGVLPDLRSLLRTYTPAARETANVDQWFLRDRLWGSIRPHALIHDRCFPAQGTAAWPDPSPADGSHVGQDEFSVRRQLQATWLGPWIRRFPCLQLPDDATVAAAASARTPVSPLDRQGISSWPGPLPDSPPPMPAGVSGRILNLASAGERWQAMASRIAALGWQASHQRQPAQPASQDEARAMGLRNGGELGLWRSTATLLEQWLAADPGADEVLHVLEDDAIPHPALPVLVEPLRQALPALDILLTEAFLTPSLYRRWRRLERRRQHDGAALLLVDGRDYLACTSSYLLRPDGARRLLEAMRQRQRSGRLEPIDMALRSWIHTGALRAAISLPFFSTIAAGVPSSLQQDRDAAVQLSQNADLSLRRLFYLQTWDPPASAGVLQELCALLSAGLSPEPLESLLLEMLSAGRAEGWLPRY